jgi:hypothetical protein
LTGIAILLRGWIGGISRRAWDGRGFLHIIVKKRAGLEQNLPGKSPRCPDPLFFLDFTDMIDILGCVRKTLLSPLQKNLKRILINILPHKSLPRV